MKGSIMSNDIKAGDLVMVVKPKPCCNNYKLGKVWTVSRLFYNRWHCHQCGFTSKESILMAEMSTGEATMAYRLKKINPPSQDETIANQDEVAA
jgi:ribosomal protein L37AE/L43A